MPFDLALPHSSKKAGWKVKIREDERLEPPHVTILRRLKAWRLNLRTGEFKDKDDTWDQIDSGVQETVLSNWDLLRSEWDRMYPENPVGDNDDN